MSADARDLYVRMRTSIEGFQPLPADVRTWLLNGLAQWEAGTPLDRALGLNAKSGEAWSHPVRQQRRAHIEAFILHAADLAGGRSSRVAAQIARELQGDPEHPARLPGISTDFLCRLRSLYPAKEIPRSRTQITQILKGNSKAQRDQIVGSRGAIPTNETPSHDGTHGNTAFDLVIRRHWR